jgi:hypothetical protein
MRKRDISVDGKTETEDEKEEGAEDGTEEGTEETAVVYRCLYQVCPRNKTPFQASTYLQNHIRLYVGEDEPVYRCPQQSCLRIKNPFTELSKLQSHNRLKHELHPCTRADCSNQSSPWRSFENIEKKRITQGGGDAQCLAAFNLVH